MTTKINDYRTVVGSNEIEEIKMLSSMLEGAGMHNVNSTMDGGGVAEILARMVPLMKDIGINATWDVIKGADEFYEVTKAFHNALHGKKERIGKKEFSIFEEYSKLNMDLFEKESDFYIIHDPQPLALAGIRKNYPGSHWIWRCHIDVSAPHKKLWEYLEKHVEKYDASIFTMPAFAQKLSIPQFMITPSIDPLSDKNKNIDKKLISEVLEKYSIDPEKPFITQISRFDRLKDPVGVIEAYKLARKRVECQLVLAGGGATDDPEGAEVLAEVKERAEGDPNIKILELPHFSDLEINALQRASDVVIQKSLKEGFGLTVTEALWKGTPVIGGAVGGIKAQVINDVTGYLVYSVEGCAKRIEELLKDPEKRTRIGNNGRELVRSRFLLTKHIKNYLLLMLATKSALDPRFATERVLTLQ